MKQPQPVSSQCTRYYGKARIRREVEVNGNYLYRIRTCNALLAVEMHSRQVSVRGHQEPV